MILNTSLFPLSGISIVSMKSAPAKYTTTGKAKAAMLMIAAAVVLWHFEDIQRTMPDSIDNTAIL